MTLPSAVDSELGVFDRFADLASRQVARAPFFAACVVMVLVWPVCFFILDVDTAQLIINTATTIVTFLLVALLQNTQYRSDLAIHQKLNAVAEALADLMDEDDSLDRDQDELRAAIGPEDRESSS